MSCAASTNLAQKDGTCGPAAPAHVTPEECTARPRETILRPSDGAAYFGSHVALTRNTALVGARPDKLYVFERSGSSWIERQKLTPSDGGKLAFEERYFAADRLAIVGDEAVVGAAPILDSDLGSYSVSAYVFAKNGSTWSQQQKLTASYRTSTPLLPSVGLWGDTIVLGAGDATVVFERKNSLWAERQELGAGGPIGVSGDFLVVGSRLFLGGAAGWTERAALSGWGSTHLSKDRALVGVSVNRLGSWPVAEAVLSVAPQPPRPPVPEEWYRLGYSYNQWGGDDFGASSALSGDLAVVGAPGRSLSSSRADWDRGAVFVFERTGSSWTEKQVLAASDGNPMYCPAGQDCEIWASNFDWDAFGWSVGMSQTTVIVGAPGASTWREPYWSRAYIYELGLANGDVCTAASQCRSGACSDGRCCDSACAGACDACSVAAGASAEGICTVLPPDSPASAACGTLTCGGSSAACAECASDAHCASNKYCASNRTCLPRNTEPHPADGGNTEPHPPDGSTAPNPIDGGNTEPHPADGSTAPNPIDGGNTEPHPPEGGYVDPGPEPDDESSGCHVAQRSSASNWLILEAAALLGLAIGRRRFSNGRRVQRSVRP
jgi:hypothetical protein